MYNRFILLLFILMVSCASVEDDNITIPDVDSSLAKEFHPTTDLSRFKVSTEKKAKSVDVVKDKKKSKSKNKKKKIVLNKNKVQKKTLSDNLTVKEVKKELTDIEKKYQKFDKVSQEFWGKSKPKWFPGEETTFRIKYFGVRIGTVMFKSVGIKYVGEKRAYHYQGALKSAKFYSYIYSLNDTVETYIDTESLLPFKYTLIQDESGKYVDDIQFFDFVKKRTYFYYKRDKKGVIKKEEKDVLIPTLAQNVFSVFSFIRGLPLKNRDIYVLPIINKAKVWLIKVKVLGRESIVIKGNTYKTIKLEAITHIQKKAKKQGKLHFWFTDDTVRKPVMFDAKVKLGSISGEIVKYIIR